LATNFFYTLDGWDSTVQVIYGDWDYE